MKHNEVLVQVTTQYYENYSFPDWDGNGSCPQGWKPKGGSVFQLTVDSGWVYDDEFLMDTVREVLKGMSNDWGRYVYLSHEVHFSPIRDISKEVNDLLDKKVGV